MSNERTFSSNDWFDLEQNDKRYLLIDGAQCNDMRLLLERLRLPVRMLFDGKLSDGSEDASVYLAKLPADANANRYLQFVDSSARSPGALTLIESSLSTSDLLQRLQRRLDAVYPNGKPFLSRFYDARVLPWWIQAMNAEQRQAFLAVGTRWWYLSHELRWVRQELHCPEMDPHDPPWVLGTDQRHALIESSYPYVLMDHFQLTDPGLLQRIPRARWYAHIREVVAMASALGMEDSQRVLMVVTWSLLAGEGFMTDGLWQVRLVDYASGKRDANVIIAEAWPAKESP